MLMIVCKYKYDPEKDAGALNGDEKIVDKWRKRSPELRPCGLAHAWVEKSFCIRKCRNCLKWIDENGTEHTKQKKGG